MESDNKLTGANGFNQMFIESVEETITGLLGQTVSNAFTNYFQAHNGITLKELPDHPDVLFSGLEELFGMAGVRVGKYIVRKLYLKAGVELLEHDGGRLVDYVEALKQGLAEAELGRST